MQCVKCKAQLADGSIYCHICGKKQTIQQEKTRKRTRANGTGTVYKENNRWTAEVTMGYRLGDNCVKRIKRRKRGFKTKTEAIEYLPTLKQNYEKPTKITLADLWIFYKENSLPKLSKSKQGHYLTAWNKIGDISHIVIDQITIRDLQEVVNNRTNSYYPAKDIKTLLSHIYDLAIAEQYVTVNLAHYIELPKLDEERPNPFTEEEVKSLWEDYLNGNTITGYALLMIYTGMMPGELFALKTSHIDLKNRMILGAGLKTEKRKSSPIVLADFIVPVVDNLLTTAKGEKFLPMREDAYRKEFKAMLERCGCRQDLVPYSCRHTTATSLASADVALTTIKEIMRHTRVATTSRYIHVDGVDTLFDAINKLQK